jgi:hypothetical protein
MNTMQSKYGFDYKWKITDYDNVVISFENKRVLVWKDFLPFAYSLEEQVENYIKERLEH